MKTMTRITATMLATVPAWIESAPSCAPTVRSSRMVIGAGSAPARSSNARSLADCTVKLPEMMPLPPRIGSGDPRSAHHVETEADHRLVVLERCLRVGERVAADHDPLLDKIGRRPAARRALLGR